MIRVLLADDQALIRQGIRALLEVTKEVEVVGEADNGDRAIALIRSLRPDVALVDVRMGPTSGIEVVRALRSAGNASRVILLTTFDDEAVLLEGVRLGISGYLLKDVGLAQLLKALQVVAAGGTLVLPAVTERARAYLERKGADFDGTKMPQALTAREREVLRLMAGGYSNREIAGALQIAEGTVKNQASSILSKLGVRDRTRAVLLALKMGLLS